MTNILNAHRVKNKKYLIIYSPINFHWAAKYANKKMSYLKTRGRYLYSDTQRAWSLLWTSPTPELFDLGKSGLGVILNPIQCTLKRYPRASDYWRQTSFHFIEIYFTEIATNLKPHMCIYIQIYCIYINTFGENAYRLCVSCIDYVVMRY